MGALMALATSRTDRRLRVPAGARSSRSSGYQPYQRLTGVNRTRRYQVAEAECQSEPQARGGSSASAKAKF